MSVQLTPCPGKPNLLGLPQTEEAEEKQVEITLTDLCRCIVDQIIPQATKASVLKQLAADHIRETHGETGHQIATRQVAILKQLWAVFAKDTEVLNGLLGEQKFGELSNRLTQATVQLLCDDPTIAIHGSREFSLTKTQYLKTGLPQGKCPLFPCPGFMNGDPEEPTILNIYGLGSFGFAMQMVGEWRDLQHRWNYLINCGPSQPMDEEKYEAERKKDPLFKTDPLEKNPTKTFTNWGYDPLPAPQPGALVVYLKIEEAGDEVPLHYGVVKDDGSIESKWQGGGPVMRHDVSIYPPAANEVTHVRFFRKRADDGLIPTLEKFSGLVKLQKQADQDKKATLLKQANGLIARKIKEVPPEGPISQLAFEQAKVVLEHGAIAEALANPTVDYDTFSTQIIGELKGHFHEA